MNIFSLSSYNHITYIEYFSHYIIPGLIANSSTNWMSIQFVVNRERFMLYRIPLWHRNQNWILDKVWFRELTYWLHNKNNSNLKTIRHSHHAFIVQRLHAVRPNETERTWHTIIEQNSELEHWSCVLLIKVKHSIWHRWQTSGQVILRPANQKIHVRSPRLGLYFLTFGRVWVNFG